MSDLIGSATHSANLVHRLIWKKPTSISDKVLIGDLFDFDYMGRAEYGFGAVPSTIVSMGDLNLTSTTLCVGDYDHVTIIHSDQYLHSDVVMYLERVYNGKLGCKELPEFCHRPKPGIDGWLDLDRSVLWTTKTIAPTQLITAVYNSAASILEQRAKRALLGGDYC